MADDDNQQVSANTAHDHLHAAPPPPPQEVEYQAEPFELFVCQICLDIAYKPIVLQGCGHLFCFWCVRRSMNDRKPSHCPACRRAYLHFPRVCRLLHFLLQKAWPLHYRRKESETQAMEQTTAIFSPRILPLSAPSSSSNCALRGPAASNSCSSATAARHRQCDEGGEGQISDSSHYNAGRSTHIDGDQAAAVSVGLVGAVARKLHVYPVVEVAMEAAGTAVMKISVEDVLCRACGRLLVRPVVINCGEVLCEWCWMEEEVASSNPGRCRCCCSWCGGVHPSIKRGGGVGVCLPLHQLLEQTFPTLYAQRLLSLSSTAVATPSPEDKEKKQEEDVDEDMEEDDGFVHVGVGCDGCGMFPIVGSNRYHCVECGEHVGYDLCQICYDLHINDVAQTGGSDNCGIEVAILAEGQGSNMSHAASPTSVLSSNRASVPISYGRFDQRHSAKHQMMVMASTQRAQPATFNGVMRIIQRNTAPLQFDLHHGTISRRRRTHQQIMDDFDDYIDNLV